MTATPVSAAVDREILAAALAALPSACDDGAFFAAVCGAWCTATGATRAVLAVGDGERACVAGARGAGELRRGDAIAVGALPTLARALREPWTGVLDGASAARLPRAWAAGLLADGPAGCRSLASGGRVVGAMLAGGAARAEAREAELAALTALVVSTRLDAGAIERDLPYGGVRLAYGDGARYRVLLVDDQELVLWGLRTALARESWCQRAVPARSGDEAVEQALRFEPHVAIVDLFLGEEIGVEVCRRVRAVSPATRVLLMSDAGRLSAKAVLGAGAEGFVGKDRKAAEVVAAIHAVARGHGYRERARPPIAGLLSAREQEVLALVAEGATNAEIAARLFLSPHTVKQHTSSLYRKLAVRNRAQAVQAAQRIGLL